MQKINFTKMVASGNDFVVIDRRHASCVMRYAFLAKKLCDRKYGVGADGLLVLEKSKPADIRMRIFNADGSEAEMCGNGARCVALYVKSQSHKVTKSQVSIQAKAGIISAKVNGGRVKIKLTEPRSLKLNMPVKLGGRSIKVNFINTGVPHAVVFTQGLKNIDIAAIGRQIRYHQKFTPAGTNADFVEILNKDSIMVRTYERGVEDETLACGTGAVASALIANFQFSVGNYGKVNVHTQSREVLKVYFSRIGDNFKNVWLEGRANIVYRGVYYV
ncbi:MAG: diaminopimelate epimerase [Candidatus Omnitrophota bacterium]